MIYKAANVQEAVVLATDLKQMGKYNWFRGQIQNWPLLSSFARLKTEKVDEALQKAARFEHWFKTTRGLEDIAANTDMGIAVAQHYGIPTTFVDFTTEPGIAGFFASHGRPSAVYPSCIICLDTADLAEFWKKLQHYRGDSSPEFIHISVPNLWRLEAQHGVFLFCPFRNFEDIYDPDRIIFPYTSTVKEPLEEIIYPKRKSQLEILLDQYFMNEELIEGDRRMHAAGIRSVNLPGTPEKCTLELVACGLPSRPASWNPSVLATWHEVIPERFFTVLTRECWELSAHSGRKPYEQMEIISAQIQKRLNEADDARRSLVSWSVTLDSVISDDDSKEFTRALQRLWDGLRLLPYTIKQISDGMACCATLALEWIRKPQHDQYDWQRTCLRVFPDAMEVEFGSDDGSYSRAYVSESALRWAVRDDISEFLNPIHKSDIIDHVTCLLQAIWAPDRLFEYDRLCELFATRIAPVQVLIRAGSAVFYSPARIDSFGLP
jgi:hypothetical protein